MGVHTHAHDHGTSIPSALRRALVITVIFMVIEFAGGWIANSLALISDAAHMLTDVGALLMTLFAYWVSRKPSTASMSFGYQRAEILGALGSGLAIWLLAGFLVWEAIDRLSSPPEVHGVIVFVVAAIGLGANLLSMRVLHSNHENLNVRAAYLHMLADSLGSISAVIAGLVIWLTGWTPIDPIVTILFSILMLASSWHLVRESIGVLMESTPSHLNAEEVRAQLREIRGVSEVHDLHIWTVSSGTLALSVHLVASDKNEQVLSLANELLENRYGILHTTIQVEHPEQFRSERCYDCAK